MTDISHLHSQVELLRYCKIKHGELKDLEANAKAAIQQALGDSEVGTMNDKIIVTWKSHKRRSLDQSALKQSHPEIYEEYITTSEVRRFEIEND